MNSNESNSKQTEILTKKATDPLQYDSINLDWKKEGMLDSPTRQFFREYLEQNIEDLTDKSVVDIGSGTGHLAELFRKFGAREIYGIEPSHKNVEISRELYPEMIVDEVGLEKAKTEKTFDVVVVVMAFEHMRNLDLSFQKIAQLTKPTGIFYAIIGDKEYFTTERFGYTLKIEDLGNGEVAVSTERPYGIMHDIFRPVSNFIEAAKNSGFSLTKNIPLIPTKKIIQVEPKYKQFEGKPLGHLLVFSHNE